MNVFTAGKMVVCTREKNKKCSDNTAFVPIAQQFFISPNRNNVQKIDCAICFFCPVALVLFETYIYLISIYLKCVVRGRKLVFGEYMYCGNCAIYSNGAVS
jgi:hypothetical protein